MPQLSLSTSSTTGLPKRKRGTERATEIPPEDLAYNPRKRARLTLTISIPPLSNPSAESQDDNDFASSPVSGLSDPDSLFDEPTALSSSEYSSGLRLAPAVRTAPQINGLFFTPTLRLSEDIADSVTRYCLTTYFQTQGINQVMLFGRFSVPSTGDVISASPISTGLPPVLLELLSTLETMLLPLLPPATHALLFPRVPARARQAILNLYKPGEGISPHVDLLQRFGDGIIGVSLGSGCVMQFAKVGAGVAVSPKVESAPEGSGRDSYNVYLPERSVIVLSEEARYGWTHGIGKHTRDYVALPDVDAEEVAGRWIERGVRLSITFRWLLPGADIVGNDPDSP